MDLDNLRTTPMVPSYCIKLLSTTNPDWDVMPADSSPKYNADADLARDQSPAWW